MPRDAWRRFKLKFKSYQDEHLKLDASIKGALVELVKLMEVGASIPAVAVNLPQQNLIDSYWNQVNNATSTFNADTTTKDGRVACLLALEDVGDRIEETLSHVRQAVRNNLDALMTQARGLETLDDLVEVSEDPDFLAKAIQQRFGLDTVTLQDAPSAKTLKKIYDMGKLVPLSHTRGNDKLKHLIFKRNATVESEKRILGSYEALHDRVLLRIPIKSELFEVNEKDHDPEVPRDIRPTGTVEAVLGTMAHEVGHAVDESLQVMHNKRGVEDHGGWEEVKSLDLAKAILSHKDAGAHGASAHLAAEMIQELLLTGACTLDPAAGDKRTTAQLYPSVDGMLQHPCIVAAVRRAGELGQLERWPEGPALLAETNELLGLVRRGPIPLGTWFKISHVYSELINAIIEHQEAPRAAATRIHAYATRYLEDVSGDQRATIRGSEAGKLALWVYRNGVNGWTGLYDQKKTAVAKLTLGGRVYTVGNNERFYSYASTARAKGVSAYQFNAPAEWFAELYMFHYCQKLPDHHPSVKAVIHKLAG